MVRGVFRGEIQPFPSCKGTFRLEKFLQCVPQGNISPRPSIHCQRVGLHHTLVLAKHLLDAWKTILVPVLRKWKSTFDGSSSNLLAPIPSDSSSELVSELDCLSGPGFIITYLYLRVHPNIHEEFIKCLEFLVSWRNHILQLHKLTSYVVHCFKNAAQNSLPFAPTVTVREDDWL